MTTTLEQVEILREKANVSYDEAKEALDAVDGDLLEALIYLEKQGKVAPPEGGGYYNSDKSPRETEQISDKRKTNKESSNGPSSNRGEGFKDLMKRFWQFCAMVLHKGNVNAFELIKDGIVKASFPVTILVLLVLFAFWITVPLFIVGLFFGYQYRFRGPDLGKEAVNEAMENVENTAEQIKRSISKDRE
jgi:hypothetical protein